jgi:hypothetical protein
MENRWAQARCCRAILHPFRFGCPSGEIPSFLNFRGMQVRFSRQIWRPIVSSTPEAIVESRCGAVAVGPLNCCRPFRWRCSREPQTNSNSLHTRRALSARGVGSLSQRSYSSLARCRSRTSCSRFNRSAFSLSIFTTGISIFTTSRAISALRSRYLLQSR